MCLIRSVTETHPLSAMFMQDGARHGGKISYMAQMAWNIWISLGQGKSI